MGWIVLLVTSCMGWIALRNIDGLDSPVGHKLHGLDSRNIDGLDSPVGHKLHGLDSLRNTLPCRCLLNQKPISESQLLLAAVPKAAGTKETWKSS